MQTTLNSPPPVSGATLAGRRLVRLVMTAMQSLDLMAGPRALVHLSLATGESRVLILGARGCQVWSSVMSSASCWATTTASSKPRPRRRLVDGP